jgi:hypothetical protein
MGRIFLCNLKPVSGSADTPINLTYNFKLLKSIFSAATL